MAKYVYPAIFSWNEEDSVYYVSFPDAANWFTDGETVEEAMENATDVLNLMLLHLEETHREADIPTPSRINDIQKTDARDVVTLVAADTAAYAEQLAMQENPIRHAREKAGLNIKQLANLLGAPYRTVQDWNAGKQFPPKWVEQLVIDKIHAAI
ncbi:type II toxin-antitoxin system HicB family antitoxin [Selenomonas sp.]|uniref:type II toxin-antitoxin system HicB family antitoxin n=1 Tax=Selenomonas sp. TaxID=2053611 RepID=UPI0025FDCBD3|nr:type II toxin-antitoxin system HicB family antitoxin [Selenomonas sp.]MCI6231687.1 type II toxin-antitoxin system HicB family antitoxin [Selenomonas sp.]MDY3298346.1 type II toxin-antitoxin system HicB family antitoxin [Selenomonas sp.]